VLPVALVLLPALLLLLLLLPIPRLPTGARVRSRVSAASSGVRAHQPRLRVECCSRYRRGSDPHRGRGRLLQLQQTSRAPGAGTGRRSQHASTQEINPREKGHN